MIPDSNIGKALAGGGTAGGVISIDKTIGLDRAAQAAGDVLGGIFGGLPWEMDPSAIVDAVAMISPYVLEVASVVG